MDSSMLADASAMTDVRDEAPGVLDTGAGTPPDSAVAADAALPLLTPCPDGPDIIAVQLVADSQQLPGALLASQSGMAWINASADLAPCPRGCGMTDGEIVSLPAGAAEPLVVATGSRLMDLAGSTSRLYYDRWGAPGLAPDPDYVGSVAWDGSDKAEFPISEWIPAGLAADESDLFLVLAPHAVGSLSVARVEPASFSSTDTWAIAELTGMLGPADTALDAAAFYVGSVTGLVRVDRQTLEPTWLVGPDPSYESVASLAVDETYVFYASGGPPPPLGVASVQSVYRIAKDGSAASPELVAAAQDTPHSVATDATHVYWATIRPETDVSPGCTAVVSSAESRGSSGHRRRHC